MIKETNVTVMVTDVDKAIEFYCNILGLKLQKRYGKEFAQIGAPGTIIALHPAVKQEPKANESANLSIGFAVDNLDKFVSELRGKGVSFSKFSDDGPVKLAFFSDPDGNPLYLTQSKWGPP